MAYTITELNDQYTAVRSARLRGVRAVQFSDRSTTYSSDAEMRQVEQDLLRDLQALQRRPRQSIGVSCKGF